MKAFKLLGLLFACSLTFLISFSANAQELSGGYYGYVEDTPLIPLCGGEGQKDCLGTGANFEGSALGSCPEGSIFNALSWSCHTCPDGYTLSAEGGLDPESDRACHKRTGRRTGLASIPTESDFFLTKTTSATIHGTVCPSGTFYDPIRDGECWSCPKSYDRNWEISHIDSDIACRLVGDFKKAVNHAYGTSIFGGRGTDCPAGQFWDGYDGGRCHSCPRGFHRTTAHIKSDRACGKAADLDAIAEAKGKKALAVFDASIAANKSKKAVDRAMLTFTESMLESVSSTGGLFEKAKLKKEEAACEDGQQLDAFLEIGQGGTCYSCPETYRKVPFAALDGSNACDAPRNIDYQYASVVAELTCPAGQDFDFINWQHYRVVARTKGFDLDKNNTMGGTCWSCPDMSAGRSDAAVFEPDACVAPDIRWELPAWTSPGVYGRYDDFSGEDLVSELINDRTFINSIVTQLWRADRSKPAKHRVFNGLTFQEMKAEVWADVVTRPETSGVLRLALKSILIRQALGEQGLPQNSQKYLAAFETAVTDYRTFLVEKSKEAFELWDERALERDVYKSNASVAEVAERALFAIAMLPWPPQSVPDYRGEAEQLTLDLQTTEAALKLAAITESLPNAFRNEILPRSYIKPRQERDKQLTQIAAEESRDYLYDKTQEAVEERVTHSLVRIGQGLSVNRPIEILEFGDDWDDAETRPRGEAVSHTNLRDATPAPETRARSVAQSRGDTRGTDFFPDKPRTRSNMIQIDVDRFANPDPVAESFVRNRSAAVSWTQTPTRTRSVALSGASQPVTRPRVVSLVTPNPGSIGSHAVAARSRSGLQKMASAMLNVAKFAEGPLLAVDIILTVQDVYGEVIVDRLTMGKQYDNALALMSEPYSLASALASNTGTGEFDLYFNVIAHNETDDRISKITPPLSWANELCPTGNLIMGNGVAICDLGCPLEANGDCDSKQEGETSAPLF